MEKRTFYSKSSGLCISPPGMKGKFENVDGETKRIGETIIQFVPIGGNKSTGVKDGEFGSYVTEDAAEIAYLEKRATDVGDVFGPEEYNRLSTPAEIRAEQANRKLEDQNRLISQLQAQIQSQGAPGKPVQPPTR